MAEGKRLVIVGGVAAGASAAAKARRTSESIEIVLLEAGPYISFANCGLPYYVGREILEREHLFVTDLAQFRRRFHLDVRVSNRAISIDREAREVAVTDSSGETTRLSYDRLILATGTEAIRPPIEGLDRNNIFTVRTIPDVDSIMSHLDQVRSGRGADQPLRALVIGGGYIGLETAEQFLGQGAEVSLVERLPQLMPVLDPEIAYPIQQALEEEGGHVYLEDGVRRIGKDAEGTTFAETESGKKIPFDIGILSVGVRPNVQLAKEAGIGLGNTGAIAVDASQRTNDEAIYAAGDNCEVMHLVCEEPVNIPLAGPANKMGRVAGANAALDLESVSEDDPRRLTFHGVLGTAGVRVCGMLAAVTGLPEREAKARGFDYEVVYMTGSSHAGYYPGAEKVVLKVLFESGTGRLLGAQGVGARGVDKRIDVLATAITGGLKIDDLQQLDLAYAPPIGSAKDVPVMAGFAGSNLKKEVMPAMMPQRLMDRLHSEDPPVILDVRTDAEYEAGHVEGALHIPVDELRERLDEVPRDREVAIYCGSGYRSYVAQRLLVNRGWPSVKNVQGGFGLIDLLRSAGHVPNEKIRIPGLG